jgi:flagellar basal-body rod modification protein FlgD
MTLLVTQMRNQDPLNPLDNAQVTSQLAQLSTVTGIDKLNTTLESLTSNFQSSQSLQAAGMIGRAVMVPGSDLMLSGGKALLGAELAEPVDSLKVNIRDAAGNVVHSMDLGAQETGVLPLGWDGETDSGKTADGKYSFELVATRGGEKVEVKSLALGEVGSVSTGPQGVTLNLINMGTATLSDVRQII